MEEDFTSFLNYPSLFLPLDKSKLLETAAKLPNQCIEAYSLVREVKLNPAKPVNQILICGLGGSGIGGELLRTYLYDESPIPVLTNHHYTLPHWVNENTLVFAVSYSGNTEETISSFLCAHQRGAYTVAITTGGQLGTLAKELGCPNIEIPSGLYPRAALGYLFTALLCACEKLDLIKEGVQPQLTETVELLQSLNSIYSPFQEVEQNPAKKLALNMYKKIPLIYGTRTTEAVAVRWKTQLNENGKTAAFYNYFTEINHNEIMGFRFPKSFSSNATVIILQDTQEHPRLLNQIQASAKIISNMGVTVHCILAQGSTKLARLFSLLCLGDYASLYLSFLNGTDPGPIPIIENLKLRLNSNYEKIP